MNWEGKETHHDKPYFQMWRGNMTRDPNCSLTNLNGTTLLRFTLHNLRILQRPAFLQHTSNVKACRIIRQRKANRVINHMQLSVAIFCHRINHLAIIIPLFTHNCLDYLLFKKSPSYNLQLWLFQVDLGTVILNPYEFTVLIRHVWRIHESFTKD